ncbi:carbohydrate esterase family 16 protein [Botryobasidium botryosum FD-172 SS1]|uniref:Carbohydrate esterase family 16 protein n=1 Tax=Botryobasidium botryosum (strain FD-172 SS1) TaxID=930990 RepID=A0A067M9B4_BOTB1|nr:carbohydrate esterase family 16 protein [Botryobasidium botryosum FD-172 SS1]
MHSAVTLALAFSGLLSAVSAVPLWGQLPARPTRADPHPDDIGPVDDKNYDERDQYYHGPPAKLYAEILVHGDSYTQTGFEITGDKPSLSNPLGNPPYPGWTACGSTVANWIGFVTVNYNTTKVLTYNFAYGGATIDAKLVTPYTPTVRSMTDQVNIFLSNVASKPSYAPWAPGNSIFSFFIGINDIGNSWYQSGDRGAFSDTLLNAYFALVQKIYDVGGRNFLFINVPGVDRSPLMIAQNNAESRAQEKAVIQTFNTKLAAKVASFKVTYPAINAWVYDSNTRLVQVLDNPKSFGFKDATSYGSGADQVWCNDYHISSNMEKIYAQDIANVIKGWYTGTQ